MFGYYRVPKGLEDVSKYPHLLAALLESEKWSEEDIAKLAGKNLIRVFKEVEAVSIHSRGIREIYAAHTMMSNTYTESYWPGIH